MSWSGTAILSLGTAADNTLVLPGRGVAPQHVCIRCDGRGLVLRVSPGAPHVYVNARPVRELALLRLGDQLGIGGYDLRLCGDVPTASVPAAAGTAAGAALRIVGGSGSGQVRTLEEELQARADGALVAASGVLRLRRHGAGVALASEVPVRVNGVAVRTAWLRDGDQLVLGSHRFVVDVACPRTTPAAGEATPGPEAPARAHDARGQMGWLVLTAALLGLALAAVLLFRW